MIEDNKEGKLEVLFVGNHNCVYCRLTIFESLDDIVGIQLTHLMIQYT